MLEELTKPANQVPINGFTVLGKMEKATTFWFWHQMKYSFQYGYGDKDWVDVPESIYWKYKVGDFCNETSLWSFNI
jgi:hypothetical protein